MGFLLCLQQLVHRLKADAIHIVSVFLAGAGDDRPMLHTHDLETLLLQRIPTYEATADAIIDTDGLTPEAIAEKISIFAYNNRTT